jgi:hypothetical protein
MTYILCVRPAWALVSKIPKYSSGRKSLTGELVVPVTKAQGGLPRIPKGPGAEPEWERLAKRGYESLFPITKKYLQNLMNRCIRGRLACPEESKGGHTYAEASADKCERRSPSVPTGGAVYSISGGLLSTPVARPRFAWFE